MEKTFWSARWSEGRIGFHEAQPNAHLQKHLAVLGPKGTVFVPLCGKARDLAYLAAQGHRVIGVEWVEDAVRAFFSENALTPKVTNDGPLVRYEAGPITLFAGDVFHVTAAHLSTVTALYDRAALIALPAEMRARYVQHLGAVLPHGTPGLLITVEYEQSKLEGPPFSVVESAVRAYYAGRTVELLAQGQATGPRFAELEATEKVFRLA